ncbi:uncharacterized protein [Coffea arabica]|uniref:RNase H type-1 domain-containing protein n=1 Tax=Coffea arabica TaxID=13443 RepID=A0ABM4UY98_COFAR
MPETKNPVEEIEVDLSQLFVETTCEEEPSKNSEFLSITEGAIQNWTADYLLSRRKFRWPQIKSLEPLDVTILEFDGCNLNISYKLEIMQSEIQNESDTEEEIKSISRDLKQYEEKPKPNLEETEIIDIGTKTEIKEVKVNIHLNKKQKEEKIEFLMLFRDVFAWSYDDMPEISTDIVVHRLPTDPNFLPVKQKPLPKKFGEVRVCIDYRDLNKAGPKDDFPLPNIHILLPNTAGYDIESFGDCFVGYHQILIAEEDREKTSFITPWRTFCYRVMLFGLKNARATYQRTMTTLFHDMIHKEMKVYVDITIKSKKIEDHLVDLKKLFERLRRYNLKLNLEKCAFGTPTGKLLDFIVSKKGIEIDPAKIKAIRHTPISKTQKDVKSFFRKINFIGRFIAQLTSTYEHLLKLLKKNAPMNWNENCQQAFDKIKTYLLNPPVLVSPQSGSSMPTGRMAKWQMILSEFDIVFITQKAVKGQVIADHLAENPREYDYQPLHTYFLDEKILFIGAIKDMSEQYPGWRLFFDGASNSFGAEIGVVLVSYEGKHYPATAKLLFPCTNNMAEYEAYVFGLKMILDMEIKDLIAFSDSDLLVHQTLK